MALELPDRSHLACMDYMAPPPHCPHPWLGNLLNLNQPQGPYNRSYLPLIVHCAGELEKPPTRHQRVFTQEPSQRPCGQSGQVVKAPAQANT